jgi:hypothetical protein
VEQSVQNPLLLYLPSEQLSLHKAPSLTFPTKHEVQSQLYPPPPSKVQVLQVAQLLRQFLHTFSSSTLYFPGGQVVLHSWLETW